MYMSSFEVKNVSFAIRKYFRGEYFFGGDLIKGWLLGLAEKSN